MSVAPLPTTRAELDAMLAEHANAVLAAAAAAAGQPPPPPPPSQQQQQQLVPSGAVAATAALAPARCALPKLPTPPTFDGSAAKLEAWTATMRQQFAYYGLAEADKVRLAAGCLSGAALVWWESALTGGAPPADWAGLDAALRLRFQPITAEQQARGALLALAQGKGPVHSYVDRFRALLARVPSMDDATRTQLFLRGLQPEIARTLHMYGVTTLDAAINAAMRIGSADAAVAALGANGAAPAALNAMLDGLGIEGLEQDTAGADGASSSSSASARTAEQRVAVLEARLAAMQDTRRGGRGGASHGPRGGRQQGSNRERRLPRFGDLSPAQVQEHLDAGKCFGCGVAGHGTRDCPQRAEDADGKGKWPRGQFKPQGN